jgi:hypothetical protein
MNGPRLENDHSVLDRSRLCLPGQQGVGLLVGDLQGAVPRRRELRACHELPDPVVDEAGDSVAQWTGEVVQAIHELRTQSLRGQGVDRFVRDLLHIDVAETPVVIRLEWADWMAVGP